ncbi:hypothetical protein [Snodgrassella communis]|uniref:hypothetical protein n=1 Tax=Snodgrassella communis TaxID=2946699 RepID=UPI001EF4F736|nr:hypothetical protein [Snodgrassella communis]WMY92160.1 hypothetical protein PYG29_01955 [Snodgrassella communis]
MIENAIKKGHPTKNLKRGNGTSAAKKNRYESQKAIRKKMVLLRMDMIMMNILMPQQNKEVEEHI